MKKTILVIFTAFIVFLGIVTAKNTLSYKIPNDKMGVQAVIRGKSFDYLFIGSSSFRKGVNMKTLENELSGDIFMLAYNGNQPMNVLVELEEIIREGTHIDTLVYELEPGMLDRGADLSDKRLLWDISMESKLKLWKYLSKRDDADFFMFYDYFVSSNMDYMFTYPISYRFISGRYYLGGNDGSDVSSGKAADELKRLPIKEEKGIDSLQMESLISIMKLCDNNDIRLIFIEPPKYYLMYEDENYKEKHAEMIKLLDENSAEYYTVNELDFDNTVPDYYSDLSHMSESGMNRLTDEIISVLRGEDGF